MSSNDFHIDFIPLLHVANDRMRVHYASIQILCMYPNYIIIFNTEIIPNY